MPKVSLKRRHRRQHDLSLLQQSPSESLNREAAARMVSDEDIQLSDEPSGESSRQRCSEDSVVSLSDSQTCIAVRPLQRSEGRCLKGLGSTSPSQTLVVDTSSSCCLTLKEIEKTPRRAGSPSGGTTSPCTSPWGQFVDMVVPVSSSSDEDFEESPHFSTCDSLSNNRRRFLPFCPSPAPSTTSRHHPYQRPKPKRQRLHGHRRTESVDMQGFVLQVPDDSMSLSSDLIVETQTAFEGLQF